jgi:L-glyceraldehyde 3-phosphate reductase
MRLGIEDFLRPRGALEGLQRAQRAGKTRFIGFVTRGNDAEAARQLIDLGGFSLINVSVNLLNPSAAIRPLGMCPDPDWGGILNDAADHGVGAAIYSPLAGWFLSDAAVSEGKPHPLARGARSAEGAEGGFRRAAALSFLSKARNPAQTEDHNLAQAAIRFVLSLQGVTVALGGFSDERQVEEVAGCSGQGPLSAENMARVEAVWRANFGEPVSR